MSRQFTGAYIPRNIWDADDLSWQEKCFLVELDMHDEGEGCFLSNRELGEFFGVSDNAVHGMLMKLRALSYVRTLKEQADGLRRLKVSFNAPRREVKPVKVVREEPLELASVEMPKSLSVPIPLEMQTPEFVEWWKKWVSHLKQKRFGATTHMLELHMKDCLRFGAVKAVAVLEYSIRGGFRKPYEPSERQTNGAALTKKPERF